MKTSKNNATQVLMYLVLMVFTFSACSQTSSHEQSESVIDKPEVDIHTAVLTGNLEAVRQHIQAGTDINEKEPMSGSTPLVSAATFGKTDCFSIEHAAKVLPVPGGP